MKPLAVAGLIAVLGACTGVTAPAHAPPASATADSVAGRAPSPAPAAPGASVAAFVSAYYRDVVRRDYRRAFRYLAPGATGWDGQKLTLRSYLRLAHMLDGMGGPVTRFSVGAYAQGVVMTLFRVRYGPYHAHLRMVHTSHGWAIASLDRI